MKFNYGCFIYTSSLFHIFSCQALYRLNWNAVLNYQGQKFPSGHSGQQYEHIYRAVHCCLLKWQLHPVWKCRSRFQTSASEADCSLARIARLSPASNTPNTGWNSDICTLQDSAEEECIGYGKLYLSLEWDNLHSLAVYALKETFHQKMYYLLTLTLSFSSENIIPKILPLHFTDTFFWNNKKVSKW